MVFTQGILKYFELPLGNFRIIFWLFSLYPLDSICPPKKITCCIRSFAKMAVIISCLFPCPWLVPSSTVFGLEHAACFGQWSNGTYDTIRHLKGMRTLELDLSCCMWNSDATRWKSQASVLDDERYTAQLLPTPAKSQRDEWSHQMLADCRYVRKPHCMNEPSQDQQKKTPSWT